MLKAVGSWDTANFWVGTSLTLGRSLTDIRRNLRDSKKRRFRSGLYAAVRLDRVSVRGLADGSVRVTRVGECFSARA